MINPGSDEGLSVWIKAVILILYTSGVHSGVIYRHDFLMYLVKFSPMILASGFSVAVKVENHQIVWTDFANGIEFFTLFFNGVVFNIGIRSLAALGLKT